MVWIGGPRRDPADRLGRGRRGLYLHDPPPGYHPQDDASPAAVSKRIGSAQRQAAASQAAAEQAIAASIRAFRRAAEAHEHAALQCERAAAAGFGDKDQHERQAARHRAAAAADIRRAKRAQLLLRAGQALNRAWRW